MKTPLSHHNRRSPAYFQVAQLLRERIREGEYSTEEFLPPERDLASELQVSRQTVRQAIELLRQEGTVAPEQGRGTRIVLPSRLVTVDAASAFQLAALIIYGISRESSAAICQGCTNVMREADFHLIVAETMLDYHQRAADEAIHLRTLIDKGIQGIIIYAEPTAQNCALLQEALECGIHVVQIDRMLPDVPCDYVGVDNRAAAKEMTQHLLTEGHRRIGFMSFAVEPSTVQERRLGYEQALREFPSEKVEPLIVGLSEGAEMNESILLALKQWKSQTHPPTAIFTVNDELAMTVIQILRTQGIAVPEQIAVVGFDNLRAGALVTPGLTTVQQPFVDIGSTAARLLLDRMQGRYRGKPRQILLPTNLVVRQSSAFGKGKFALTYAN